MKFIRDIIAEKKREISQTGNGDTEQNNPPVGAAMARQPERKRPEGEDFEAFAKFAETVKESKQHRDRDMSGEADADAAQDMSAAHEDQRPPDRFNLSDNDREGAESAAQVTGDSPPLDEAGTKSADARILDRLRNEKSEVAVSDQVNGDDDRTPAETTQRNATPDAVAARKPGNHASVEAPPPATGDKSALIPEMPVTVPKIAAGRAMGSTGRVKTRLLGFSGPNGSMTDPFAKTDDGAASQSDFPIAWLVVVDGPGRGAFFTIYTEVSQIGRGPDQPVRLDFGDNSISRENHAAIAFDAEQRKFFLGHGGKANLVRLNNRPVLSTEELRSEDQIRIGETVMRFIALCGPEFCWNSNEREEERHVSRG